MLTFFGSLATGKTVIANAAPLPAQRLDGLDKNRGRWRKPRDLKADSDE